MTRSTTRLTAAAAGLAACALVITGCSAGQITQTATQEPAVNGTAANIQNIALRNVHLQAVQKSDFLTPGTVVPLVMVASNNAIEGGDKLLSITSDVGQVALAGDSALPAGAALVFNPAPAAETAQPTGEAAATAAATMPPSAQVTLSQPITNGLTYNFTFNFEKAGKTTVAVPVSAGDS